MKTEAPIYREDLASREAHLYADVYAASIARNGDSTIAKATALQAVKDLRDFLRSEGYID